MLPGFELKHSSIEKEVHAIIEAVCHWKHYPTGKHLTLRTDQKSTTFMFDLKHRGKVKIIKSCVGALSYHVSVLILCINRVGTIPHQTFFLKFQVPCRMKHLFDSCTMHYAIQVLHDWHIIFAAVIFPILLKTSNQLYPSVKYSVSVSRDFIGPNRETLSESPSCLRGLILI